MADYADLEHDSEQDGHTEALTEPLPPEQSARQMLREDMREARAAKLAETQQAVKARYSIKEYPAGTEAANDEWLSLDNDALFNRLR